MIKYFFFICCLALICAPKIFPQPTDSVTVTAEKISGNIYMLKGSGGNLGACVGDDGIFLVDDQYAPLTGKILAALSTLSDKPVRFVLNTHWHRDHTGGNENLGKAGSIIVAHDNVRKRMSSKQFIEFFGRTVEPSPKIALPVVTFSDSVSFHLQNEEVSVFHVKHAHTDGDVIVHFKTSNVIHTGDVYMSGMYPLIDVSSGGSSAGVVAACDAILAVGNEETRYIPGHGNVTGGTELRAYRDMVDGVRASIAKLLDEGKTLEEVKVARPTGNYDAEWGKGFMSPEKFVELLYSDISGSRSSPAAK